MEYVSLSPNDRDDILKLLEYALKKKLEEQPEKRGRYSWDNSYYYKMRINQLSQLIKGRKVYDTIYQSSLGSLESDIENETNDINSKKSSI